MVDGEIIEHRMTTDEKGRFVRAEVTFRDWVQSAPAADHPAKTGRYHLYLSVACPWCHRVMLLRKWHGLEQVLPASFVRPFMGDQGWSFEPGADALFGATHVHEIYTRAKPDFTGRITVPVLWDVERGSIVNNESRELIQMLDGPFAQLGKPRDSLFPKDLRDDIDRMITANYAPVNNGVYRAGFATSQEAYDEAVNDVFERLDALEALLSQQRYLCGDRLTAADICLFPTLLRFEPVYHYHFKCSRRRLRNDYPALWAYTRDIYQTEGLRETVDLPATREHYFTSHESINPSRVIPTMPDFDLDQPHGRG